MQHGLPLRRSGCVRKRQQGGREKEGMEWKERFIWEKEGPAKSVWEPGRSLRERGPCQEHVKAWEVCPWVGFRHLWVIFISWVLGTTVRLFKSSCSEAKGTKEERLGLTLGKTIFINSNWGLLVGGLPSPMGVNGHDAYRRWRVAFHRGKNDFLVWKGIWEV